MTLAQLAIAAVLAVTVLDAAVPPAVRADDDPRLKAYQEQLDRMQREMDELRERLRVLERERGGAAPAPAAAAPAPAAPAPVGAPAAVAAPAPAASGAAPTTAAAASAEQDRKIGVLAAEVERLKSRLVLPEGKEYKSLYGFGPAASKVYQVERGLSLGGYGEYLFQKLVSDQGGNPDRFDMLRLVLYAGYKFNDWILFNSEIEFEHAVIGEDTVSSEGGEVSVEFAALDFMLWQPLNVRAGLLLVPMGFLNEIHEPPFFHGVFRPEVERRIIPTTWREGGVGFFGTLAPGLEYRAYLMNGLNAEGFESSGIREGRQLGDRALAESLAGVVRLDYTPLPGIRLGGSAWLGDSGQDQDFGGRQPGVFTTIWETHGQVQYRGLELRALGAFTHIDDADILSAALNDTIATDQFGFYAEAAYDVLPLLRPDTVQYLAPFFRYEIFDTQDGVPHGFARVPGNDVKIYQVGLSYKPHPQVVLKLDYRNFHNGNRNPTPDDVNLGAGFVF